MPQKVAGQFAFAYNVFKRFVEVFYQIVLIMSYESIYCCLNIDAQIVKETIINKPRTSRFFILYNNMNIYEGLHD